MNASEKAKFVDLLTDAMGFYKQSVSTFALSVWWQACENFDLEQVAKAITAHAMDPERGQFAPKPADIVRQLQGTHTDRSLMAWGKVLETIQRVGAYRSVVFDDPAIHSTVTDMGGWPAVCRSKIDDLPFVQKRFCEAHRAYSRKPESGYPARLVGDHEQQNAALGYEAEPPLLIGNPEMAKLVLARGGTPKTQITSIAFADVLRLPA